MTNKVATIHCSHNSCLISTDNIVMDIGDDFLMLSGYSKEEIVGKNVSEVFIKLLSVHEAAFEQLKKQNEQLINIIENLSVGVVLRDNKGNFIMANSESMRLLDPYCKEHINKLSEKIDLYDMDGSYIPYGNRPFHRASKGEYVKNLKYFVKTPQKDYFMVLSAIPICNADGDLNFVLCCYRDITRTIENEMIAINEQRMILRYEKEKNEALRKSIEMKDEFISLISHEFKTPLTVIISAIQAMEHRCKDELSEKANGYLNIIKQNSNRQLKLVNNFLDITRLNAGHLKTNSTNIDIVNLTRSITDSIRIFAEQKGILLSFASTLKRKVITIDEEKYERILLNLLSNAIKFTPKGQSVTVKVSLKNVKGKDKVIIKVEDKGVGIPKDKKKLVFKKFGQVESTFTKQAEGTGIGLHLVKLFLEIMGGEIKLRSKEGEGSTFTVLLPADLKDEKPIGKKLIEINDNRLIRSIAIEFSDVYV